MNSSQSDAQIGWEPHYQADIWWCGDEVCDCHQPQILLRTPNVTVGRSWFRHTVLWQGTFHSDGVGIPAMVDELEAECARRGIPRGYSRATDVSWDRVREIDAEQMKAAKAVRW